MRKAPVAASILRRLAPETAKAGVQFAVPPQRIALAPWLQRAEDDHDALDELSRRVWSFGLTAPLVGRESGPDRYELIAEPEFLEAARRAEMATVRLHVVDIDDAVGYAIAEAARARSDDAESISALRSALDAAHVVVPDELLAQILRPGG